MERISTDPVLNDQDQPIRRILVSPNERSLSFAITKEVMKMPNKDGTGPKSQGPKNGHGKGKGNGQGKSPGQGPMTGGKEGIKEETKK
jgi:hypothetical protein